MQLLDRKQKAAEKRRAALEDITLESVQVSTVMIKNGDCKYKTFAKRWRRTGKGRDFMPTLEAVKQMHHSVYLTVNCRHEIRLIKRFISLRSISFSGKFD